MLKNILRFVMTALFLSLLSMVAFAADLASLKAQGLVGERANGYVGVISQPSSSINSIVTNINQQRRAKYQAIAKKNGTSLDAVEQLAGQKAISLTPSGQFVQINGRWVRK